jgi:energy-coupling factor transporter ATP-binding protein EcfA2
MSPAIEVRNLQYRYPAGGDALRGVSFSVAGGECVGLIGPNGAGKSTLLLHLNGLLPNDHGAGHDAVHKPRSDAEPSHGEPSVLVDGGALTADNLFEIRRKVGLLFQDPNDQLFCPTVFEDVAFGPEQFGLDTVEIQDRVARALAVAGIAGFEERAPHHLSVGEKRRVCLAGVLACDPSILVLDEPTSSLDPRGRRELKELLRQIPITKLIATHDLELVAELCSRVIVLDVGMVVAEGPTIPVLSDEALMLRHNLECPHILRHLHPH